VIDQLSVRARLTWAFGALSALVLAVSCVALYALNESNARFEGFIKGINARANMAQSVRTAVDRRAIAIRNLALVTKPEDIAKEKTDVSQSNNDVHDRLEKLVAMGQAPGVPDEVKQKIRAISDVEQAYGPIATNIFQLVLEGKRDEAITKMNDDCRPHLAALVTAVEDYRAFTKQREEGQLEAAANAYSAQRAILLAACLITFLVAVGAGITIVRSLTRALGAEPADLNDAAKKVAQGDLNPVKGASSAPAGSVLANLSAMQQSLAAVVSQVRNASDSIATGSAQIATGNADLSQRTEEQASNLQQTAASMEQMNSTVKTNADTAQQASQLAATASESAARGGDVVNNVVATMEEITASSRKIADIIGVIDGIAFQTNILALNAAVEAARAGEQGRGFAVVAGEVRNLAQRSAEAAREIKSLIGASVDKVEAGSRLVGTAGSAMQDIVTQVKRVTDLIGEISSATVEQTSGIGEVSLAVTQLDQVTQQNAALVEESAAAAESLKHQAQQLAQAVSVFKVGAEHGVASRPTPSLTAQAARGVKREAKAPALAHAADSTWESF
jgi:methyl-accepting chemotaxis protein-1 (serine sensor receptor)